ncbi:MAG TPA: 50S ribosomal protein L11 methyltransferase [Pyrinomonadaceae bacterium]|nr:50S ribosomal protein L11 methyltransferase [Pyrinomonadaceae bacterium]
MNSNNENWFGLEITVAPEAAEAVEFALNSVDALGTAISFRRVNQTEALTVTGYFNQLPDDQILQDELHYALRSYDLNEDVIHSVKRGEIENADWLAEWKRHWKPTTIGRFVIAPPWSTVEDSDKIVIRIEPNMAFGTGTHETTQLCIAAIDALYQSGDSFLDVGTGTGILAIAAAKISATENTEISKNSVAKILACDTDADSVKIARENAVTNGVGDAIDFYEGPIADDSTIFDFVCANLTIDVILPILPLLIEKTGKTLVLSGILKEQEDMIVAGLAHFAHDYSIEHAGEWISVLIKKGPPEKAASLLF